MTTVQKTQFAGYDPEVDLADKDWTLEFNQDAAATVLGVKHEIIDFQHDPANQTAYNFPSVVSEAGVYLVAVQSTGVGNGIASVEVDGITADEIIQDNDGSREIGFFHVDIASVASGDIDVTFNSGDRARCSILVVKILGVGISGSVEDSFIAAMDAIQTLTTDNRNSIIGLANSTGDAEADHFWAGLNKQEQENVDGSNVASYADLHKFIDTNPDILASTDGTASAGLFGAVAYRTPVPYLPSGQGADFEKVSSDAHTAWSWDIFTKTDDMDVLALVRPTSLSDFINIGVAARISGSVGSENFYTFQFRGDGSGNPSGIRISKNVDGAFSTVLSASFVFTANTNYWMRFRVRGSDLKARIWEEGTDEPSTWNIETTDSDLTEGRAGIWHFYTPTTFEVGHFQAQRLYPEWPSSVPENFDVNMQGGPQSNKVSTQPAVGPSITRRRASTVVRTYSLTLSALTQTEYLAFVDFHKDTLREGTTPFMMLDPMTGEEKTFRFSQGEQAYTERFMRSGGSDYSGGLYQIQFDVTRLD